MKPTSFFKQALIYGLGNVLLQAAGIVLLPLYTRCLTPGEYGTLEVLNRLGEVLAICLLFNGMRQAILLLHSQAENDADRRRVGSSAVVVLGGGAALGLGFAWVLSPWFHFGSPALLRWAVFALLLETYCSVLLAVTQARSEAPAFVAFSLGQVLARIGLCVWFVAGLHWGIAGAIAASLITSSVAGVLLSGRELARAGFQVDLAKVREMAYFALPFVPCGLGFFLLNHGDRFFLLHFGSEEQVGVYALGYKLATAVMLVSRTPLTMVWGPRIYEVAKQRNASEVFGRVFTWILAAYVFAGLGLGVVQDEVVALVGGAHYAFAASIIGPVVLGYYFLTWADLMDGGFYIRRRTGLKALLALPATLAMMLWYGLLIPPFGAMGAAVATLLGFFGHALVTRQVVGRVFTIRHETRRMAGMLGLAIGLWVVARLVPIGNDWIPFKLALCLQWPLLVWGLGLVRLEEKQLVRVWLEQAGTGFWNGVQPSQAVYRTGKDATMVNLSRKLIYPLARWRSGETKELQYLRAFERSQFLDPDQLRDLQLQRLRALLEHAARRCPFYRERFRAAGMTPGDVHSLEELQGLPPLERRELQEQRDELIAQDWPRDDLILNQTGGSSGAPVSFFLSGDRKCSRAAATVRHNRWAGWDVGDRAALLWGAPRDVPPLTWRNRLRNALLDRQLFLDTGHITEEKLEKYHRALLSFRPKVILAYARSAVLFARFLQQRGYEAYRPHALVTSAEVLTPPERTLLEAVFGCHVFNRYGSREFSVIASECATHDGLHVMAEGLYVEIVRGGRHVGPGETGAILITDLFNHAMPLIRYRIGDMASWQPGQCSCGRGLPRLKGLEGRVTDFLVGADGRLVSGAFLTIAVAAQRVSLGQIQIEQNRRGLLHYRIKPGPGFREEDDVEYLRRMTRCYLGERTDMTWERVSDITPEPSGKIRFSRSTVVPEFLMASRER